MFNEVEIILLGWNENTCACLEALIQADLAPAKVFVPYGFDSLRLRKQATENGIPCGEINKRQLREQPTRGIDFLISASWPFIIDVNALNHIPFMLNTHGSLLPKYRGCHPINWALINDEKALGVTVHLINEELDAGDIVIQREILINDSESLMTIREKVHFQGGSLLVKAIHGLMSGSLKPVAQNHADASYAPRRHAEDGRIDWHRSSRELFCLIRATSHPGPGAFFEFEDSKQIVWNSTILQENIRRGDPGDVIEVREGCPLIMTGDGALLVLRDYEGNPLIPGCKLGRTS